MHLTIKDRKLIAQAQALVGRRKVRGGATHQVGCILITEHGKIFKGVCMDLSCGIGFCAEHAAIAQMITLTNETHIRTIVAADDKTAIPPCGRCRELLNLLDAKNFETEVIISNTEKVKLRELLPSAYEPS
jgi:cytidine deaminase